MTELGIPYELLLPDGGRLVVGNSDLAKADPDWVGWLDPEQGIAGLDSPDLREVAQEIVAGDGGLHLDFFHGRRPIVINGAIDPNVVIGTQMQYGQRIKRAGNAMRADAILSWTNTGFPKRRLRLRSQAGLRISGRRPKTFQVPMVDSDWRILSDAVAASAAQALGAIRSVTNLGDVVASPTFIINGPCPAPILIENVTTGLSLRLKAGFALAAGEQLVITTDPPYPTVKMNGIDKYDQIDFLPSTWWGLLSGAQDVRVSPAGTGDFIVQHRHAWI